MTDTPIVFSALLPHAPILVPAVAGNRGAEVVRTVVAMREVARRMVASQPEALLLISPHSPRRDAAFGIWKEAEHRGSLEQFGAPQAAVRLPQDKELAAQICREFDACGIRHWSIRGLSLDHGAVVPMWFLQEAGWNGPTVIVGLSARDDGSVEDFGASLGRASKSCRRRIAIIASGDMSHRLHPGAPAGFHPQAARFDQEFIALLKAGDFRRLAGFDAALQHLAAEDALDSTLAAAAAAQFANQGHEVLSYEGPFGVGYGVAVLHAAASATPPAAMEDLAGLARRSVVTSFTDKSAEPPVAETAFQQRQAPVFVTIRNRRTGELRGCVGTLAARRPTVVEEVWRNARLSAFSDSRFHPVAEAELDGLIFEVSVLHSFEDVASATDLDPARFGVVASTPDGRSGLLLPGISGIDTAEEQVRIARRKGAISERESVRLRHFQVVKFTESNAPAALPAS